MVTLEMIADEIREFLSKIDGTPAQKREELMERLLITYHLAEEKLLPFLIISPEFAMDFVYKVNTSLGAVNEVLFKEFGIQPVYIKELKLTTIEVLEEYYADDIDILFEKFQ